MGLSIKPDDVWSSIYDEYYRKFGALEPTGSVAGNEDLESRMRTAMRSTIPQWNDVKDDTDLAVAIFDTREVMELTYKTEATRRSSAHQ